VDSLPAPLPPLLVTVTGQQLWPRHVEHHIGYLIRDIRLDDLLLTVARAPSEATLVLDVDSVDGLGSDAVAIEFVTGSLGLRCLMTRRPALATRAAELGVLSLLRVFALDSTGLGRALAAHPRLPGMGTVISPGILLPGLVAADGHALTHPLVSDGMIQDRQDVQASWAARADTVVVGSAALAGFVAEAGFSIGA
jgi:glycerol-3-phosphate responsive antiterminator